MTRDEAIRKFQEFEARPSAELAEDVVDFLAWAGLLKLENTEARKQRRFMSELMKLGMSINADLIWLALERAGLQITEKEG